MLTHVKLLSSLHRFRKISRTFALTEIENYFGKNEYIKDNKQKQQSFAEI